jgi:hypothetical protein
MFGGVEQLLVEFWAWSWKQLNSYIAEQLFNDETPAVDPRSALLREFDYIWDLRQDERMRGIAFLCFVYYRRASELGGAPSAEQDRFENRVSRLCESVLDGLPSPRISTMVLQVTVMNWCATVLMAWQFTPDALTEIQPAYARLGLKNMIDDVIGGRLELTA